MGGRPFPLQFRLGCRRLELHERATGRLDPGHLGQGEGDADSQDGYKTTKSREKQQQEIQSARAELEHALGRKLTGKERRKVHDEVSGEGFDYSEMMVRLKKAFGCP